MATRKAIVEQLQNDIRDSVKSSRGYNTDPVDVRVGVFDSQEFTMLPSMGIWVLEDIIEDDLMDNAMFRRLNMIAYAYVDSDGLDNYSKMYDFIADLEKFFYNDDNTYKENTYLGNVVITYGGTTEQLGLFVLNFSILYSQSGLES